MSYVNLGARKVPGTHADKGRERAASAPAAAAILSGVSGTGKMPTASRPVAGPRRRWPKPEAAEPAERPRSRVRPW